MGGARGFSTEIVMPREQRFDIPQELRQLAEENVERARELYVQFMDGVARNMAMWSTPSSDAVTPGFNEVRERAVKLAKENADAAFAWQRKSPRQRIFRNCSACKLATYNLRCGGTRIRRRSSGS
jgi:hypothetical protein